MGLLARVPGPKVASAKLKLFISHSWRYSDDRLGVHDLLQQRWRKGEDFIDLAVPADHPIHGADDDAELFDKLRQRILRAHVLLVMGGMYANNSAWIETEVTIARALGIPVLTVVPLGQERIASAATRFENGRVRWRGDSIREAILAHAPVEISSEIQRRVARRHDAAIAATYSALLAPPKASPPRATILTGGFAPPAAPRVTRSTILTSGLGSPPVKRGSR